MWFVISASPQSRFASLFTRIKHKISPHLAGRPVTAEIDTAPPGHKKAAGKARRNTDQSA
ncbi:hypothetical protein [Halomonas caseinilytica]|uniref:hypothetical protein n=1 Tax=Halomonas caseinilytica TaxID=438744 RepID=UPI000B2E6413|nr:hypothetical protein [Halomonas caseinilytica]